MTVDVVIVGAGAAGIGAGLELAERGVSCVILEAAERVGGRAFTDETSLPYRWDHGCHWLHCADVNPLVAWADRLGASYLSEIRSNHFAIWSGSEWLDDETAAVARSHTVAAFAAVEAFGESEADRAISDVIPDAGRWSAPVRHILSLMASEDPERVSAKGYADYEDTGVNWPVISGYGNLVARMAAGLPVRLGVAVTGIDQQAGRVRIQTTQGTLDARAVVVTASTNVLLSGAIRFGAGPARDILKDFVGDVPCGAYEKVAIALRRKIVADERKLFCMIDPGDGSSPVDFQIVSSGEPVMIAHMAGDLARGLAAEGRDAMADFAVERLALAFGYDVRKEIVACGATGWGANPFVRGGYSYARPGAADRRQELIAADTGNVAFAGEALSRQWQATAHGAYQSGRDVAARLAAHVLKAA